MSRRVFLKRLGIGAGAVTVVVSVDPPKTC
jgi:hypothetical protein